MASPLFKTATTSNTELEHYQNGRSIDTQAGEE